MPDFKIIEPKTEKKPHFFEFKKRDIVSPHPTMANLTYDPYPDAEMDDVVRREIIGWELILHAKLKGNVLDVRPDLVIEHDGHKFTVLESEWEINSDLNESIAEIVGGEFITLDQPVDVLARLRRMLAADNPKT